ncbi:epiplakin-like [Elgaria multicarinata webbii]|uniref:epiplakin-like n=1 Tax=Elgaria multicarinata webbii TaxID=159646 RepID=UPI002FCCDCB4
MEARASVAQARGGGLPCFRSTTAAKAEMCIRSIAGVYVEASGKAMRFSDAVREHLLQPDLALALLEAQAATGGIVDPVGKQLISVAEALAMGLVGLEIKEKLLCAERAVTGFTDPYTEEKIPLYQAIQKELIGREQGLHLLEAQIATGGIIDPATGHRVPLHEAYACGFIDEEMSNLLSDPGNEEAKGFLDPNSNQKVPYMELMRRCIADPATGLLLLPLKISFPGLRGSVCSHELLDSRIIDSPTFKALHDGEVTAQEVAEMDSVQQYLSGTNSIAGVAILPTGECRSLYQALTDHLLMPGTAVRLLQAQAATGCLIDPEKNEKFTAGAAVRAGVVGPGLYEKLSSAEKAVTGYRDPFTGETLSLFQAMKKGLVPRDPGLFLLEAQLATGGIIDPHAHHRLPVEVACQRGHLDRDLHSRLCNPTDDIRGFLEPNTKENLSYAELVLRCVTDPDTGLCLLPLSGDHRREHAFIDHSTQVALRNSVVSVPCGRFQGKPVSLWHLLFSDYFTREQRRALVQQFCSGALSTRQLANKVCLAVQQVTDNSRVTFEGLRDKVTPAQLLSSEIINKDLFEKLTQGETLPKDVVSMGMVKKYLEGTGCISGLLLPDSQEKISIYQGKRRGFLRPGTSLILLEAQAATGYIIDPAANKKYSVDEALRAGVVGPDVYDKLVAAEKAVTGYRDPYTGDKISLFQAMMKDLIVKEHAIRLLEAQIATGGIIDPVNSHRLPVEAAYKRGYFDKKMNLILSDPSDDTKGFFDPNTHENLTYLQLKEKCITEPSTGLCLLPLNSRKRQFIDDATKQTLRSSWLLVKYGRFQGQQVSVWDLLNSEYFSEGKRREIFNHYSLRKVTLEQIRLMLEEEMKKWARIQFPALRGKVTAYHLVETGILEKELFERLLEGAVSPEEVLRMDSVRKYLYGTGSIGGVVLQPSNERVSLYEAIKRSIALPGVVLPLLEAQAATGFIIDPVNNQKLCLDDAVREGLVGPELYEKLQRAEEAVTGYMDPFTGQKISLYQAMKKGLVADKQAIQLMDAQLSTGGVIDPHSGHYVPVEFAQRKGYLDEDFCEMLSKPSSHTKVFNTLDSKENVTYGQLINRCQTDEVSGIHLLPLSQRASPIHTDEQVEQLFRETLVEEKGVSLWELLTSGYFTEEQRREFLEQYRSGAMSLRQLLALVQGLIKEIEMKAQTQVAFQGLRGAVPAVWLLDTGIISEKTFIELAQGRRTAREVSERESVKKYLQGTGGIAGVFIQASQEKMSIYQAMQNNLLLPGTGARLLEAQAATGTLTDPVTNQRLGVEEAVKAGIVGEELTEQLLQAERALTGYPDPYSGKPISVCQAIRKELIAASAGIPLLEAQLATGGVIDPLHHHHLPLHAAYKHGFYDEEMHQALSQHNDDTCVFFDPNTQESLAYQQLKDRCIRDAETGLFLLPLSEDAAFYGDRRTMEVLKSVTVFVNAGRFKGQEVSLWDLLNSEYISNSKRRELVMAYKEENAEILQEMIATVTKNIEETEQQGKQFTFKGLRKQVSASDLFQSQLIDKETLDELRHGKKTVQEVTEMDSVRQYLEGCNFIAGVLVQPSHERMSIYQAWRRGLLRPGVALVLLEAQAATGFLIDPVKNKKLSVDEAMAAGLIGREIYEKLLSAEKAVTGYTHPYTKGQISLFEAMNEELIVKSHGIRLLEAQIATGGIIDPVHSYRIPVEVAYKRGYFDEKMNQILSDPTDDTKGFFDPNTHENLTYLQLLERCIQDPGTGLYMLQIVKRGERYFYIDETTKQFLKAQPMQMHVGRYKGQSVSMWDLLCSPYIHEQRRKDLVSQYKCEDLTLEQLSEAITTIIEETDQKAQTLKLKGPRGEVSAAELFNSEIIDKKTLDGLHQGAGALQRLAQKDSMKRVLEGTGSIAGVLIGTEGQRMTIFEAMKRGLLSPENALMLLEAQAATGFILDPLKKKTFSVDEAVSVGLIGEEIHEKLLFAEKAVTGYTDPSMGNKISLFQAMKQRVVEKPLALRLLEAQIATGGIIDPIYGHRIPVEVACKRGYMDDHTFVLLSDADYATKGFVDPNTQGRITYAQLLHRCTKDTGTGMYLLQLIGKRDYFYVDEITKNILSSTKVNVTLGKYRGQTVSLWELLSSDYINEEKKKELIRKYKQESSAVLQHIINEILKIITEKEESRRDIWFQGLRKQVTAAELLKADIIGKDTMKDLEEGKQTPQDVAQMDSVRRYLEGTSCIAGVLVPSRSDPLKTEKMTIYQAMQKGILRPGTALVLLEAQAATGFITDPLKNEKLSVNEATSAGLVGGEIHNKLLCAEKAVTGYTDPNTGGKISLFQAMGKDLIIKEHGIRLLEAQIATGGIIDPVNSHRVPIEMAYKRGYFDEKMNQKLLDPTDETKGFFDPNTHENLTYKQLLKRCTRDPDTGLLMLRLHDRDINALHLDENIRKALKTTTTKVSQGNFQGQVLPLWDLLFSHHISDCKREELLSQYRDGRLTLVDLTQILTALLTEATTTGGKHPTTSDMPGRGGADSSAREEVAEALELGEKEKALKSRMVEVSTREFHGRKVSVWEVLHSKYIPEEKRKELMQLYLSGVLTVDQMETVVTTIVNKTAEEKTTEASHGHAHTGQWEDALRNHTVVLHIGEFHTQEISLWDLLFSQYVPETQREGLLMKYRSGILSILELIQLLTPLLTEAEGPCGKETEDARSPKRERPQSQADGAPPSPQDAELESALRLVTTDVPVGEFQGHKRSVWELLFSKYVTTDKRHELLERYRAGSVTAEELVQIITALIEEMEQKSNQLKFSGLRRQVTASELFDSQIIDQDTLSELTHGTKTVGEVKEMESVKRYLEGTSCIAGVLVPSRSDPLKTEKMTIYQAMWKGVLRPGTALVLLEAQAATGFITDPLKNEKLSVSEAVSADLVGGELQEKLLSAERAITGYNDPYTGNKISLFQAMKKGLIVKDHGIRLLEAQIATGGIIDPVHSHRLPVEVAYERGYFDQEMNQILSDPTDDTKGFFDPNTHENLTYMQLRNRCLPDPDTGLLMLQVMDKGSFSFHLTENTRKSLQSAKTRVGVGLFQGQEVSLWDLLFSRYVPPHKRLELLRQYKAGTISLEDIQQILITIITETEGRSTKPTGHKQPPGTTTAMPPKDDTAHPNFEEPWQKALKSTTVDVPAGEHRGQTTTVWDLLFSRDISEEKRTELLGLYRRGLLPMDRLISLLTTLVTKKEASSRTFDIKVRSPEQVVATSGKSPVVSSPDSGNWESALRSQPMQVPVAEFQDQQLSAWDLLFSHHISDCKREELLSQYRDGRLTLGELTQILTALLTEATTTGGKHPNTPEMPSPDYTDDDDDSSAREEVAEALELGEKEKALKSRMVEVSAGEFHGRKVSVWEVLHSKYIPEEKRKELMQLYLSGVLTVDQMETVITTIVNKTEEEKTTEASHGHAHTGQWEDALRNHTVVLHIGEFHGQEVSLWDLLFSQYVPETQREGLLMKYRSGILSILELIQLLTPLLTEAEGPRGKETEDARSPKRERAQSQADGAPPSPQDAELESALRLVTTDVPVGEFQGHKRSVWELLFSKYVTTDKRHELLERYRAGSVTAEELVQIITALIEEMEQKSNQLKFSGLRRQVTASELFDSQIIDQDTLSELTHGTKTVGEVKEMESVKRYLEGTSCIAGVLVPSRSDPLKTEKMTIYQAMWKGVLRPGTALVLLEAQAATGFITDPLKNEKLSVSEAVSADLVGGELQEKLLSAERAVTGYNDPYTGNKISLFQAMKKGLIVKDHGIRLLEAQIATGGIIDPVHSHRLPVEVAYERGYFDQEMNQILSDPTDDTKGFFDPNTHENLTYMQLRNRCLPDPDTGLLMLQVMDKCSFSFHLTENTRKSLQSAKTRVGVGLFQGQEVSLWDLLFSRYVPPHKRLELLRQYKAGTISLEDIQQILITIITETEERSTKPTGHKQPPGTPTAMPPKGDTAHPNLEEPWQKALKSTTVNVPAGEHRGQTTTVWDLLFSRDISEEKRTELLGLYRRGLLPMDRLISLLTTLVTKKEASSRTFDIKVRSPERVVATSGKSPVVSSPDSGNWESALRSQPMQVPVAEFQDQQLSAWDLLFSHHISDCKREELLSQYRDGRLTLVELTQILTALLMEATTTGGKHPNTPEMPSPDDTDDDDSSAREEVAEALELGEKEKALKSRMVEVSAGEFHGRKVSVWEVLHSKYIPEEKRKELMQLYLSGVLTVDQMETVVTTIVNKTEEEKTTEASHGHAHTGQWEDALRNHTVVLHIGEFHGQEVSLWDLLFSQYVPETQREGLLMKYRSGILSILELIQLLTPLLTEAEGPRGKETEDARSPKRERPQSQADGAPPSPQDAELESALRLVTTDVPVGEFQGHKRSVWELLFSKYVTTDKRHELLERYRAGSVTAEELVQIITALIEEMEQKSNQLKFSGLRRQVTASELFDSQIIDQDTLSELTHGTKTVGEVKEMESVKRYLEGTSCIAGVLVPSRSDPLKTEKMTIYQAMWKGVLRPGTALVLLEAQAATGFITDPLKNEKLSVSEAVSADLVGGELQEKLLSAERAVTGYNDPYTGNKISLFQAMKKGLIVKDHGIRLLEAQIATGGIIDPVHSHRLPVEVAYERGYFDQEMNQILSDPTDDTKGFFDPNTHENLTYMQLRNRCLPDPDTGLLMLQVMDKGSFSFHLGENIRKSLQSAKTRVGVGLFQGQEVSLWDLLFSRYVPPHKRLELLRQYKAGTISLEDIQQILITIITETEERSTKPTGHKQPPGTPTAMPPKGDTAHPNLEEPWQKALKSTTVNVPAGEHRGQTTTVWDLLFSRDISEEKRTELLGLYRRGLLPMDRLISLLTTLVTKKEASSRTFDIKVRSPEQVVATSGKSPVVSSPDSGNWESALRSQPMQVPVAEFQDQQLSAWDLLFSHHISDCKREELLSQYRDGRLTLGELTQILTALLTEATTTGGKHPNTPEMPSPDDTDDDDSSAREEVAEALELDEKEKALKSRMVEVSAGEFHGRKVSVWEVLHSKYIPEEKRKELMQLYLSGVLTVDQMETVITTIVNKTEEEKTTEASHGHAHTGQWEDALRNHTVVLHIGEFHGQEVSLWDLLFSQYISDSKREELLGIYRNCQLTPEELTAIVSTLISELIDGGNECSAHDTTHADVASSENEEAVLTPEWLEKEKALKSCMVEVSAGEFHGRKVSVWELLHSKDIPEEKRKELLQLYKSGILTIGQMETVVTTIVNKMEEQKENTSDVSDNQAVPREPETPDSSHYDLLQHTLRLENIDVTIREIHGQKASVWDPFFSRCVSNIRKEEILHRHGAPTVSVKENFRSITTLITQTENPGDTSCKTGEIPTEHLMSPGTFTASHTEYQDDTQTALKSRLINISVDEFHEQQFSVWDLLHSKYIPEEKRKELLRLYKSGVLTVDQMETVITTIVNKTEEEKTKEVSHGHAHTAHWEDDLRNHTMVLQVGEFQGQEVSLWDLLFSQYISEYERDELLNKYRNGSLTLEELRKILAALPMVVTNKESKCLSAPDMPRCDNAASEKEADGDALEMEMALKSRMGEVSADEFHGRKVSVWELLHSNYIPEEKRKELLQLYRDSMLTIDQMETVVTAMVNKTVEEKAKELCGVTSPRQETRTSGEGQNVCFPQSISLEAMLRSERFVVPVGEFQGQMVSCWDVLLSKYISEDKKQDLLNKFRMKAVSVQDLTGILTNIITEAERRKGDLPASTEGGHIAAEGLGEKCEDLHARHQQLKKSLRTTMVQVTVGEYKGQKVCVLDLLFSKYVPQDKRQELLELYRAGTLPIQEMITMITTMTEEVESKCGKSNPKKKMSCKKGRVCWKDQGAQP